MKLEEIQFVASRNDILQAYIWLPDTEPCMVLQVCHGMTEHMGRYEQVAEVLTSHGIVVAGFDLRGHGKNPKKYDCATLGENGWIASLEDIQNFREILEDRFHRLPHVLMGVSLGAFLLHDYLSRYPAPTAGAVFVGSGNQPDTLISLTRILVNKEIKKVGFNSCSPLIDSLSFKAFNRKFAPNRTFVDWLCSDEEQIDIYCKDNLCWRYNSAGLLLQMLDSMQRSANYTNWNKELPVLFLSGMDDPVGNFGKGPKRLKTKMNRSGISNVQLHLFPKARHDIFHEYKIGVADEALKILINWLKSL